jgi:hypothetical protein
MNLLRTPILILLLSAFAIFAFFFFYYKQEEKISNLREHRNFYGVKIIGSFDSEIVVDKEFKVELEGDESYFENVKSEVSQGDLIIYSEKKYSLPKDRIKVKIILPELKNLVVSGNSTSEVSNVNSDKLTVTLNGRSTAKISGEAKELILTANGESEFNAEKLNVKDTKCKLYGASRATIFVSEKLDVEALGASSLDYLGKPKKVLQHFTGGSSINSID